MKNLLAQGITINGQHIEGPLKGFGGQPIEKLSDVINILVVFLYPLAGILLFIFLVWGGYDFLLSGGDPEKVKSGKAKITSALIGFILLVLSFFIVRLFSYIFGLGSGIL